MKQNRGRLIVMILIAFAVCCGAVVATLYSRGVLFAKQENDTGSSLNKPAIASKSSPVASDNHNVSEKEDPSAQKEKEEKGIPLRKVLKSEPVSIQTPTAVATTKSTQTDSHVTADQPPSQKSDTELLNDTVAPTGRPDDAYNHVKVLHQQLASEARDPDWADAAEAQLKNYIAQMPSERINVVSVQCASTVCEIQAVTQDANNAPADLDDWQDLIFGMVSQPWWAEYQFSQPSNMVKQTPDKRELFVAYMTRLSAPTESQ